jgi:hypothetical protein
MIKVVLERLGERVLISATKDAYAHAMAFNPDVVVFNHLHSEQHRAFSRILKENGRIVVVLPTEGTMRPEFEPIGSGEFSDYRDVDLFLAWNDRAAADVARRWSHAGTDAQTIGCTRFDFHHPRFVDVVTTRQAFCAKLGLDATRPIVTWATAYAYASLSGATASKSRIAQFEREAVEIGIEECLRRISVDLRDLPAIFSEGRNAAAEAFFEATRALPEVQFVIKRHPLEDLAYYQTRLAETGLDNVRFCPQDYIWNLLRASDVHLHRHCTTAVEAWMWGRPTIEMGMDKHPARSWSEREAGSDVAEDAKELTELLRYRLTTPVDARLQDYRSSYIRKWFGDADGHRCEAAAAAIHRCAQERQAEVSHGSIRGLGVSYREMATAVLRRWLNRAVNEPVAGRRRPGVGGGEDKWIRRGDVTGYERLLRAKVPL